MIEWSLDDIDAVAAALRDGHVVVVPTDTVYGVAAPLDNSTAVAKLFTVKRRPTTVALPVVLSDFSDLANMAVTVSDRAQQVAAQLWPGALTLVLPCDPSLAQRVGGVDTLGVRVPDDDALRALVRLTGPLAVTSANEHGEPPCTSPDDVHRAFDGRDEVAGLWNGGLRNGVVSTVVRLGDQSDEVLRSGAIDPAVIAAIR